MSHTHLAGPVKRGVVDQRDASLMCSASQTPTGVPVPQAGGGCSAMKVGPTSPPWEQGKLQLAQGGHAVSGHHQIGTLLGYLLTPGCRDCNPRRFQEKNSETLDLGVGVSHAHHLGILLKHRF